MTKNKNNVELEKIKEVAGKLNIKVDEQGYLSYIDLEGVECHRTARAELVCDLCMSIEEIYSFLQSQLGIPETLHKIIWWHEFGINAYSDTKIPSLNEDK